MNIRYPIYEGVYRILTLKVSCSATAKLLQRYCKYGCSVTAKLLQRYCKYGCSVTAKLLQNFAVIIC